MTTNFLWWQQWGCDSYTGEVGADLLSSACCWKAAVQQHYVTLQETCDASSGVRVNSMAVQCCSYLRCSLMPIGDLKWVFLVWKSNFSCIIFSVLASEDSEQWVFYCFKTNVLSDFSVCRVLAHATCCWYLGRLFSFIILAEIAVFKAWKEKHRD